MKITRNSTKSAIFKILEALDLTFVPTSYARLYHDARRNPDVDVNCKDKLMFYGLELVRLGAYTALFLPYLTKQ
jgi:hypothetical protein